MNDSVNATSLIDLAQRWVDAECMSVAHLSAGVKYDKAREYHDRRAEFIAAAEAALAQPQEAPASPPAAQKAQIVQTLDGEPTAAIAECPWCLRTLHIIRPWSKPMGLVTAPAAATPAPQEPVVHWANAGHVGMAHGGRAALSPADAQDAKRYRFIRDADRSDERLPYQELLMYAGDSLDAAIDAAMADPKDSA